MTMIYNHVLGALQIAIADAKTIPYGLHRNPQKLLIIGPSFTSCERKMAQR